MTISYILSEFSELHYKQFDGLLLYFLPYTPYDERSYKEVFIDSYYSASNKLYHTETQIMEEFRQNSITAARFTGDLKRLFVTFFDAKRLRNSLVAIEPFGSRIVLGAMEIKDTAISYAPLSYGDYHPLCKNCIACERACPTGAIAAQSGKNCIREWQNQNYIRPKRRKLMGNKLLGCDLCQRCCPLNANAKPVFADNVLTNITLQSLLKGSDLHRLIGKNFARPKRIAAHARGIIKIGNMEQGIENKE